MITCKDGVAEVEMKHINYEYEKDRPTGFKAPAEELITDKYCLNKKGNKLNRITGKFRRKTVDRFEEIIEQLK
jgi:colicin import membrane protein